MVVLILGLLIFLGVHSVRIVADPWRTSVIAARGEGAWKGLYSLASVLGFVLIVWGYGLARQQPVVLWASPGWTRHAAALLVLFAFIGVAAAYVPANAIKARLRHPMLLGVKVWALAHLLANNTLADVLLFGSFLVWAVLCFKAARARDRAAGTPAAPSTMAGTAMAVAAGVVGYVVFALWLHVWWIGVSPFAR